MKKILLFPFALLLSLFAMAQSPVAYYPLNGNANDAIGTNHGTVNGAVLTTDRFGNANSAYSFDGVDDFISTANLATTNTDNWTMMAWVKPSSISQADGTIVINGFDNSVSGNGYTMLMTGNGVPGNVLYGLFGQVAYINSGAAFTTNNIWYHAAIVRQSGTTRFYLNGAQAPNISAINPLTPSGSLRIGSCNGNRFWNGSIDEVKIFNTALTAAQVQQQYNQTNYSSQFNNSVKMNGVNDYIQLPSALNGATQFTIEYLIKTTETRSNGTFSQNPTMIGNEVPGASSGEFSIYSNNGFIGMWGELNTGTQNFVSGSTKINNNQWHHVAASNDGVNVNLYVDGIFTGAIFSGNGLSTAGFPLRIGANNPASIGFVPHEGSMDEVRFWNTARTQAQIVANMNNQLTGSEAGLVGYWDMNRNGQGAGLTVDNKATATGAPLNGTTVGTASTPIFAPGVTQQKPGSGNAISFDGVNDYTAIPHSSNINFSLNDNFSIECWLKIPATQNDIVATDNMLIEKWNFGSTSPYPFTVRYYNQTSADNGKIRFGRYNGGTGTSAITATALSDDKFHHISCVKNGGTLSIYVDGIFSGSAADITTGSTNNIDNLYFASRGGAANFFKGTMDEIRIWNTALTQSQIRDRMCRKITATDALYGNLVAYYNFDESTGVTSFDGTANNNNGTLTNSPTRVTSGASIGTASSHDYVNAIKTTSITHPTGESFTVTSTSGSPDGIHVYRVDEKPNTLSGTSGVGANDKYFGVFQVNGTTPQYTAVYNYNGNPNVNAGNESPLRLNKRNDNAATSWTTMVALPNEPANTITVTGESTEYILGTLGTPLPLNLISFSGSKQNNDALLQWKTANETGVSKFEVQRSNDGQTFATIGTVAAGGLLYSLTDANTFSSRTVAFYRLKSIDVDARFTYSNILKLSKQTSAALTVYPNPVSDVLTINGLKQNGTVLLYNADGKLLQQQTVSAQTMTMDMSKYAKGMYLLQYKTEENAVSQKIIKN